MDSNNSDIRKITEEAAEWFVQLRDIEDPSAGCTLEQAQRQQELFKQWLTQSPEHVHEYLMISQLWSDISDIESTDESAPVSAPEPQLAGIGSTTGNQIETPRNSQAVADANLSQLKPAGNKRPARRSWPVYALAASILLAIGTLLLRPVPVEHFATGLGELRTVTLDDGSTVSLNTQSELIVSSGAAERRVQLVRGEALFTVVADTARPFIVDTSVVSQRAHIRVLGTRFNIFQHSQHTSVTVIEGRVLAAAGNYTALNERVAGAEVDAGGSGPAEVLLRGGQQLVMTPAAAGDTDRQGPLSGAISMQVSDNVNVERALAWTEKKLIFDNQPLAEIVAEYNRYNDRKLLIGAAALADMRLSGVFDTRDPADSLVVYLNQLQGVRVETRADGSRVILASR